MPSFQTRRTFPYSPLQLTELVADVRRYPDFLPWCKGARVYNRKPETFDADLIIGFKMFQETFTSRVSVKPGHQIAIDYLKGPLKRLDNLWTFKALEDGGTEIHFEVDFEFKNRLLQSMIGDVFAKATDKMMQAFEDRADALYGADSQASV